MQPFRFRLEKVLEWRRTQLELEEENYRRHTAVLAEIDRRRAELEASGIAAEQVLRAWNPVSAGELEALGHFRVHVRAKEIEMLVPRAEAQRRLAAQEAVLLEARRRLRLLEKLKERKLSQWRAAAAKELDEMAAEAYLATWDKRKT
jgi:flagellar export protein FliJ